MWVCVSVWEGYRTWGLREAGEEDFLACMLLSVRVRVRGGEGSNQYRSEKGKLSCLYICPRWSCREVDACKCACPLHSACLHGCGCGWRYGWKRWNKSKKILLTATVTMTYSIMIHHVHHTMPCNTVLFLSPSLNTFLSPLTPHRSNPPPPLSFFFYRRSISLHPPVTAMELQLLHWLHPSERLKPSVSIGPGHQTVQQMQSVW